MSFPSRFTSRRRLAACLLALIAPATHAAVAPDLFFSEYVEGSSNNKAIEIYNGTGADVSLSAYSVEMYANGAAAATNTVTLSGTLANGDVYVIGNTAASQTIKDASDILNGVTNFNGDDALSLKKSGVIIDSIGQIGFDPGTVWGTAPTSTLNNSLVRKATVCAGDAVSNNAFDPAGEWDGFAIDTLNLGSHNANCPPRLTIGNISVTEGNSGTVNAVFTVTLANEAGAALTVDFATANGTATTADNDYVANTGQLSFTGTAGQSQQVTVVVNGDATSEGNETFTLTLSNPSLAGTVLGQGTATILNDDVVPPALSAGDVSIAEGNSSTSTLTFTVTLDRQAPSGGVSVNYATANGTATAGSDYVAANGTLNFAEFETQKTVDITINGDTAVEPNETFELRFDTPAGLTIADATAVGTITADDLATISQIQGNGAASPLLGQFALTRGIVTARVSNGFYMQSQQADVDADPTTSEGMFVFTSSAPSVTDAVLGNLVEVGGTVAEFVASSDPNQQSQTQITGPTLRVLSTSNTLPTPVVLDATLPDPAGTITQLERLENMRVSVPSLTVVAATDGSKSESNATANTNGRFSGVVTGVARPFRTAGLEPEDAVGYPAEVPRFDGNPERLAIDSLRSQNPAVLVRSSIDVDVGATVSNVVGVLDYAFRSWRITLDVLPAPVVAGGQLPRAVTPAAPGEYTVATYNLERFYDDVADPLVSDVVLTPTAYQNRLAKASMAIRNFLRTPDIIGVVEMENLSTLQALAAKINADAVAAGRANPLYTASLVEGNDVGGIDVGFLVKTAPVRGSVPRVEVGSVTQFGKELLLRCPDGSNNIANDLLNDHPPLVLQATVNASNGASEQVTVIANHLKALIDINSSAAATAGQCTGTNFASAGDRNRQKRLQQAQYLANLVQERQVNAATENVVLVGDFNAFEFNDGFVDVMGIISGNPTADVETVVSGDGADLVTPNLVNLVSTTSASQRYGYVFVGNAQNLDHVLINVALAADSPAARIEHARLNADFGEDNRGDASIPVRLSDHDPVVAYFRGTGFGPDAVFFRDGFED